jgi:UDP-N-acetylglucosamine 2-epimerase (non-hydrolysing)
MNPFPEEVNRRLNSVVAGLHFAPTPISRGNLIDECVDPSRIVVTGNTVVDAAHMLMRANKVNEPLPAGVPDDGRRIILVTLHRRESWGIELENVCDAIAEIVAAFDDVRVVYPVHLNPNVKNTVQEKLGCIERVHLTAPMGYFEFISLLRRCYFALTDSGGVQEEAPTFCKPVLVARKVTERPEASMRGLSHIVGTSRKHIVKHASKLLTDSDAYRRMSEVESPYGDGKAARRIATALSRWLAGASPVLEECEMFSYKPASEYIAA